MTRRTALAMVAQSAALAQTAVQWKRGDQALALPESAPGRELTLEVRASAPFKLDVGNKAIHMVPVEGGLSIEFRTDANPAPLNLFVPRSAFSSTGTSTIVLTYREPKLNVLVDGVLVDEEWPHGAAILSAKTPLKVDDPAIEEIRFEPRARAITNKGSSLAQSPIRQIWRPDGHNASAGDAMPFFHDGRFHVFYLFDRRHHASKWGLGAHQWAHISTTDLRNWTHHPRALELTSPEEGSICTGSVFYDKGTFYAFYAVRKLDRKEQLGLAISRDGIHFEKVLPTPFEEPNPPYARGPNRDPFVYRHPSGTYQMLVTAELAKPDIARRGGALERLTSTDLRRWTPQDPFLVPGYVGHQPECPDLFEWNGWFYLFFGQDGATRYRVSRNIDGPWSVPADDMIDSPQSRVMKTAPFGRNRRIGVSFIVEGRWGGDLVFRELVRRPDGTLGTRTPPELQEEGKLLPWKATALTSGVTADGAAVQIRSKASFGAAEVCRFKGDGRIRARLRCSKGTGAYGIAVRGSGKYEDGMELRIEPSRKRVEWRPVSARSLEESRLRSIEAVEGLEAGAEIDILVRGDVFDVCINGQRTLIHRQKGMSGESLFLWVHNGEITAQDLSIVQL
jgi:beta-fructofuranosidase